MLTYEKANRLLQDKQNELYNSIPAKYQDIVSKIISCEYHLTLLKEGHEVETHEDEIKNLIKFKI